MLHPVQETIPSASAGHAGPSQVIIEIWGGGGEGGRDGSGNLNPGGASSGSYSKSIISLTSANYGQTMSYVAGASVPGHNSGSFTGATGNASSVMAGTFSMTTMSAPAGIGGQANAAGAAPANSTGGNTTNTAGNAGGPSGQLNGAGAPNGSANVSANTNGSAPGGGGGGSSNVGSSGGGAAGRAKFSYS